MFLAKSLWEAHTVGSLFSNVIYYHGDMKEKGTLTFFAAGNSTGATTQVLGAHLQLLTMLLGVCGFLPSLITSLCLAEQLTSSSGHFFQSSF